MATQKRDNKHMNLEYINNGYFVLKNLFDKAELTKIKAIEDGTPVKN